MPALDCIFSAAEVLLRPPGAKRLLQLQRGLPKLAACLGGGLEWLDASKMWVRRREWLLNSRPIEV